MKAGKRAGRLLAYWRTIMKKDRISDTDNSVNMTTFDYVLALIVVSILSLCGKAEDRWRSFYRVYKLKGLGSALFGNRKK